MSAHTRDGDQAHLGVGETAADEVTLMPVIAHVPLRAVLHRARGISARPGSGSPLDEVVLRFLAADDMISPFDSYLG